MADPQKPNAPVAPAAAVAPVAPAGDLVAQLAAAIRGEAETARQRDMDALARQRAVEDETRNRMGKTTLVAVTSFTLVDDENPTGRTILSGSEFEVSLFDLQKYAGKGLPRAPDPLTGGVTVSQA
ncbi:hypothetical protein [Roseomonas indoligenes]|uniref:Uncharacterized protein n=1 Tax=Roseomonas indoligenes TaxID=2820811 RepID=A0A940MUX8_9PROT|nr:hypothetical protein [Pararoseomonas indoligenes]MBP0492173.1 hypothetical protein [Pararoseomonas indoligenes]